MGFATLFSLQLRDPGSLGDGGLLLQLVQFDLRKLYLWSQVPQMLRYVAQPADIAARRAVTIFVFRYFSCMKSCRLVLGGLLPFKLAISPFATPERRKFRTF